MRFVLIVVEILQTIPYSWMSINRDRQPSSETLLLNIINITMSLSTSASTACYLSRSWIVCNRIIRVWFRHPWIYTFIILRFTFAQKRKVWTIRHYIFFEYLGLAFRFLWAYPFIILWFTFAQKRKVWTVNHYKYILESYYGPVYPHSAWL